MPKSTVTKRLAARPRGVLSAILLLGACTTTIPPQGDYSAPIPAEFSGSDQAASNQLNEGEPHPTSHDWEADWISDFGSDELRHLIVEALENNFELRQSEARLKEARAGKLVATGALLPQFDLQADAGRRRTNFETPSGDVLEVRENAFDLKASLSWELDLWGRLLKERGASVAELYSAQSDFEAARLSLSGRVAQAWFSVVEAREQSTLASATAENFTRSASLVRGRYERGLVRGFDLRLVQANAASARSLAAARRQQLTQAKTRLEVLLGRYPDQSLVAADGLPTLNNDIAPGIPSALLTRRPDLSAARSRAVAAELKRQAAWRSMLPRLSLVGEAGYAGSSLKDIADPETLIWTIVGGIVQPIFKGGQLVAQARAADARGASALAAYTQSVLTAFKEVEDAVSAERNLADQERHLVAATRDAVAAEQMANDQYARGLSTILELLEAQRRSLDSQSSLLTIKRQRLDNRIQLYLALGGGVPADGEPVLMTNFEDEATEVDPEPRL